MMRKVSSLSRSRKAPSPWLPAAGEPAVAGVDPCTVGTAIILDAHQKGTKPTVTDLARLMGVTRPALYENVEFAPLRKLAHDRLAALRLSKQKLDSRVQLRIASVGHQGRVVRHLDIRFDTISLNNPFAMFIHESGVWHEHRAPIDERHIYKTGA